MTSLRTRTITALALTVIVTACDKGQLMGPQADSAGPMFNRYVAIGNSITAGFQSFGMNDSTQMEAYPVLLAQQFGLDIGTEFKIPAINSPGCPPPFTNIFTQTRLAGGSDSTCTLRKVPVPTSLNNLAFPGAELVEALDYTTSVLPSATDLYKTLLLGGQTQIELARAIRPTFVTVWLGNNDILGAVLDQTDPGSNTFITDPTVFASRFTQLMSDLDAIGSIEAGALIGVVQVALAPYSSRGGAYFVAAQSIPTLTVDANCLDFDLVPPAGTDSAFVLVPFHYGAPLIAQASAGIPTTLDCSVQEVITAGESLEMILTVAQYNAAIEAEAMARGWIYLDPNSALLQLAVDPTAIRPFPAFDPSDPQHEVAPFGTALSRDGLHPSASTHVILANMLIDAINTALGLNIPPAQ